MTNNEDGISSLPDDVLCHILSFLPTKYSVGTRILSTRWKYLFASVSVLDFQCYTDNRISGGRFIDFVNMVFMAYNVLDMIRFRLICRCLFLIEPLDIDFWILSAISRNVQEVDISLFFDEKPRTLPCEIFSSGMLTFLKVEGTFEMKLPSSAFLPNLKTLYLGKIYFDHSAWNITSICPKLEDLSLDSCDFGNVKVLDVTHPILRKLRIYNCKEYDLVLNAPSLLCFEYLFSGNRDIRWDIGMTSLVKADICPKLNICFDGIAIAKLYNLVSHARHLYLSMFSVEGFEGVTQRLPTFHKLTRLELGGISKSPLFEVLPDLLNKCILLEVLVFTVKFPLGESYDIDMIMRSGINVPSCVKVNLKEIEFKGFTMRITEWKLVEYFLHNAQVLNKMKIQSNLGKKRQLEFTKKLSTFSKLSKDCQIVVDWDDEMEDSNDKRVKLITLLMH